MPYQIILSLVTAFNSPATVYGFGELMCGESIPVPCEKGAVTASGIEFNPADVHVAVHIPLEITKSVLIRPAKWEICVLHNNKEYWLPVTDKKGRQGFDLSPGALEYLGIEPTDYWSSYLTPCSTIYKINS